MKPVSLLLMKPAILVGGQAVIEGVMMRVPGAYATAVRAPDGELHVQREPFTSLTERKPVLKWPILRGMIALYEALKMGFATLQWSAEIAMPEEQPEKASGRFSTAVSTLLALVLAIGLFMVAPLWITTSLLNIEKEAVLFNLVAGIFRIAFFVAYLGAISLLKDVRRLFQYHGAEHRVVYNFESGQDITVENAQRFPTQHPRCGTSFLFIVLLTAIIVFAAIDTLLIWSLGTINLPLRLAVHLPLIPLVSGVAYELIKLSARHGDRMVFKILRAPGLWLQRITTKIPEDEMVTVAIKALQTAFGERYSEMVGRKYVAEAIG